jgi:hypothetical protein
MEVSKDTKKKCGLTTKHYYFERKEAEEDLKILKEKEIEFWERNVKKDVRDRIWYCCQ